jgi:hypothetical protein
MEGREAAGEVGKAGTSVVELEVGRGAGRAGEGDDGTLDAGVDVDGVDDDVTVRVASSSCRFRLLLTFFTRVLTLYRMPVVCN